MLASRVLIEALLPLFIFMPNPPIHSLKASRYPEVGIAAEILERGLKAVGANGIFQDSSCLSGWRLARVPVRISHKARQRICSAGPLAGCSVGLPTQAGQRLLRHCVCERYR
jgi:hypothetical protein